MPSLVQEIVSSHFADLNEKALTVIADDEKYQRDMALCGDKFDEVYWKNFYRGLEEFRSKDAEQTDCAWKKGE